MHIANSHEQWILWFSFIANKLRFLGTFLCVLVWFVKLGLPGKMFTERFHREYFLKFKIGRKKNRKNIKDWKNSVICGLTVYKKELAKVFNFCWLSFIWISSYSKIQKLQIFHFSIFRNLSKKPFTRRLSRICNEIRTRE
jgi:hypothetical protein